MLSALRRRVSPETAVAAIVLVSFAAWAALGYAASVPRFFMDELYYMKAGVSVAQGHGLRFEGQSWGYGPVFPLLIAGFVKVTSTQESAYELIKLANAAFFALASIPIYLVSRRLLPQWPSVAVVGLSALIPSSMYVSVSMTESLGYLLAWWSIHTILRVLERPTVGRQFAALGVVAVAIATRAQFVSLLGGYLLGLMLVAAISPARRSPVRSLWPTSLAIVAGLAWVARPLVQGHGVGRSLGSYSSLAQSYDPMQIAKWFLYHVGDLALYVGVVPLVVAPIVLVLWWQRARGGSETDAAFVALFVAQNVVGVGLIAAFASTDFGLGILYDRYLFYLVPLWLLLLVVWIGEGMPKPARPLAVGVFCAVVAVATLPFGVVGKSSWFQHFEAVATGTWAKVALVVAKMPLVSLRGAAVLFVAAAAIAVVASRGKAWLPVAIVVLALAANLSLAWRSAFVPATTYGLDGSVARGFVDDRIGATADVTVFYANASCARASTERFAALETDYFNRSVRHVVSANQGEGSGDPSSLTVRPDGRVFTRDRTAVAVRDLVAPAGLAVYGRRLGTGLAVHFVLWRVDGQIRLRTVHSDAQLFAAICPG